MAKQVDDFSRFRVPPGSRGYALVEVAGVPCPWRVVFLVDGVECGGGQYQTVEQAEDAGVDFMFSGWGDGD